MTTVPTRPVSTTAMTDMVRFLVARVDDDETEIKKAVRKRAHAPSSVTTPTLTDGGLGGLERLRAENNAKREVIASAQQLLILRDQPSEKPVRDGAASILRSMALTYSEHPSFRSEWA